MSHQACVCVCFQRTDLSMCALYVCLTSKLSMSFRSRKEACFSPRSVRGKTCTIPSPQALAEALKTNGSVTLIVLSYNQIGAEGAKARSAAEGSEAKSLQALAKPKAWSGAQKPQPRAFFHNFLSNMSDGVGGLRV